jgi:hypothetical protein
MQPIQANIGGFSGQPSTVFAAYDPEAQRLTVAATRALHKARREGCLVIGNIPGVEQDVAFADDQIRAAIDAWQGLRFDVGEDGAARLIYSERARRADPASVIEPDGLTERGRQYRLAENATNEHVATLAVCLWAFHAGQRATIVDTVSAMVDELLAGGVVTIPGLPPWETNPVFMHGFQVDQAAAGAFWPVRDKR